MTLLWLARLPRRWPILSQPLVSSASVQGASKVVEVYDPSPQMVYHDMLSVLVKPMLLSQLHAGAAVVQKARELEGSVLQVAGRRVIDVLRVIQRGVESGCSIS